MRLLHLLEGFDWKLDPDEMSQGARWALQHIEEGPLYRVLDGGDSNGFTDGETAWYMTDDNASLTHSYVCAALTGGQVCDGDYKAAYDAGLIRFHLDDRGADISGTNTDLLASFVQQLRRAGRQGEVNVDYGEDSPLSNWDGGYARLDNHMDCAKLMRQIRSWA